MQVFYDTAEQQSLIYQVAGQRIVVETRDPWSAEVIEQLFAGWYLTPDDSQRPANGQADVVVSLGLQAPVIPRGWSRFEVAGGGECWTNGHTSYIELENSIVAFGRTGSDAVEVWISQPIEIASPELTRVITYALSAALRRRDFFELHSAAVIDPVSKAGALIIGPSGSGKSTLTVQLATAGWSFLTDDVLLLGLQNQRVKAWPLRRSFAITAKTYASSSFLRSCSSLDYLQRQFDGRENDKRRFAPEGVFDASFNDSCIPEALFFTQLGNGERSQVMRLSTGETMSRLIRMNPWSCYDRPTAANHLAALSALAAQSSGYSLVANQDLLDPQLAANLIGSYLRSERKQ